ncbi:hypothetical protein BD779DRAFT_1662749 [Infundibulicybe gibba]|nr:hypothetical protein BD779DRAFT_1662749 [Infundibulicybe gibba]
MSDIVIREYTALLCFADVRHLLTDSSPFACLGLRDGGVWVLASTPLSDETRETLDRMGPVKYIIGANAQHYLFLGEFKKAYPDAKLIAPQGAINKVEDASFSFDGAWGKDPADTQYGFEGDIKALFFSWFKNQDVAFLHLASKTLIQADLLFNPPPTEQYSKSAIEIPPRSWSHSRFLWNLSIDKEEMRRDAMTVAGWDFERIIPCHGDVIEEDANAAWRAAYQSFLDPNNIYVIMGFGL